MISEMPRPRILGTPRLRRRETNRHSDPQCSIAPRQDLEEPDCEIIMIDEDDDEKDSLKLLNRAVTMEVSREQPKPQSDVIQFVKQCPMRLQQFDSSSSQNVVSPISSALTLQFVPDTSAMYSNNAYSGQSVVMVLPVNSVPTQLFNAPTLCTLEKIENPNEISRIKNTITVQQGNRYVTNLRRDANKGYNEGRKKVLPKIFTNSTTDGKPDSIARSLIPWRKRKRSQQALPSANRMNPIFASGKTFRNVNSTNGAETLEPLSIDSDSTVESIDIQECFVSISNDTGNTHCLVDSAGSDSPPGKSRNGEDLANQLGVSEITASPNVCESSDVIEYFISESDNAINKCPSNQHQTSSYSISTKKQDGSYSRSRESGTITSSSRRNKRPLPRLNKIVDKAEVHREPNITISLTPETRENVHSLENEELAISTLPEMPADVDFSVYEEKSFLTAQQISDSVDPLSNGENSISLSQGSPDDTHCSRSKKRSVPLLKELAVNITPLEIAKCAPHLGQSKEIIESNDSTNARPNSPPTSQIVASTSSEHDSPPRTDAANESSPVRNASLTKSIGVSRCKSIDARRWTAQCIACKETFSNRNELHRHATLAHPDVQISFCDFCSDSFLTNHELQEHRTVHGEHATSLHGLTLEAYGTDDENEHFSVSKVKSTETSSDERSTPRHCLKPSRAPIEPSPGHSRTQKGRPRGRPPHKKITTNAKTKNRPMPCSFSSNSSGVERRKPQTKNKTVMVKYSYVEEDVVRHGAMASKSKFKSAEIKQLVVMLTRLDDSVLQRYLKKLAAAPIAAFNIENPLKQETHLRNEEKCEASSSDSKRNVVPRRGKRKRWPSMKLRREEYAKLRNHRHVEAIKKYAVRRDSDTDEIVDNNGVASASRVRGFSNVWSTSEDEKISASENAGKKRKYDYSQEPMDSDGSTMKLVSETRPDETDKATRAIPTRKRKSALNDGPVESSDERNDAGIPRGDLTIMRKLTSRSSVASVVAVANKRRLQHSQIAKRRSNGPASESSFNSAKKMRNFSSSDKNTFPGSLRSRNQRRDSSSHSDVSANEDFIRQPDEINTDEMTTENGADIKNEANVSELNRLTSFEASKKLQIRRDSLNTLKKTYLPSRRCSEVAAKLRKQCNEARINATRSNALCSVCEELLATMKRVTTQFESRSVDRNSVKCPFCDIHFIAMFYLEEHVAGNHLRCESETPCRRSRAYSIASTKLDCETEVKIALECPQCTARFAKEEDLNDHIITDHSSSTTFKEISTTGNTPDYLNDLSNFCFRIHRREETVDSSASEKFTSYRRIVERNENAIEKDPTFVCWLCDAGFEKSAEHARHLKEVHDAGSEEVASTTSLDRTEQTKADREYLLKQLLSDDSMDGFEEVNDSEIERTARKFTVESVEEKVNDPSGNRDIALLSSAHTCKVYSEEFNQTQEKNNSESNEKVSESARIETSNEDFPMHDNVFASNSGSEDIDNSAPIHEQVRVTKKIGYKRTARNLAEKINRSIDQNSSRKKLRREQIVAEKPEASETRDEKRDTLKEILETEAGLANDTSANDKLPIECEKCNRKFPNQASLNEHLFFLHDDSLKDTVLTDVLNEKPEIPHQKWHCHACRQDFKFLQGYRRHRYLAHGDESMVHVCENCCKILTTVTMVNVHICTDVASYNCRTCDETFTTGMSLRLHNTEKHMENDDQNTCEPCNKNFLTKSMLKRHEKSRHRFLRPYRPRKRSPVLMATHDAAISEKVDSSDRTLDESEGCENRFNGNESEGGFFGFEPNKATGKDRRKETSTSSSITDLARKRVESRKEASKIRDSRDLPNVSSNCLEINENEIHRCSLCRLHCLTKSTLEIHMAKSHSGSMKVCQICRELYARDKVIRHMMDCHINPCETFTEPSDSICSFEEDTSERDVELFVRILGMQRLTTLWDYRGRDGTTEDSSLDCSACGTNFSTLSAYRFHIFMNHDATCLLCNIEFKSAGAAAEHRNEEHRSASCYMWFVDRTLRELEATSNFYEVVERCFMNMISCDTAITRENDEESFEDPPSDSGEMICTAEPTETFENVEATEETDLDENARLSVDLKIESNNEEKNDEKFIIVVTDEDLEKYNIGTHHPNIWGLAAQISSTCESLTPKDVKEMLESYFEN